MKVKVHKALTKIVALVLCSALLLTGLPMTVRAEDTWYGTMSGSFAGGGGTKEDPYQIATGAQLAFLATRVNAGDPTYNDKHYILTDDINLNKKSVSGSSGWIPIGSQTKPFKGHFDGNGKTISNMMIKRTEAYQGLFGEVAGGTVENLCLYAPNVEAGTSGDVGEYIGGMAGAVTTGGIIRECRVMDGYINGTNNVGGIAGYLATGASVMECRASVSGDGVTGSQQVGGIVGLVDSPEGGISNCIYETHVKGADSVGGIVGQLSSGSVEYCYTLFTVKATGNYAGGIAGSVKGDATLRNCVALNGKTTGPGVSAAGANAGRITGYVDTESTLENNMAVENMVVMASTVTKDPLVKDANQLDGEDISKGEPSNPSFWKSLGFDETIWLIEIDDFPRFQKKPDEVIGSVLYLRSNPVTGDSLSIHPNDESVIAIDEKNGVISRSDEEQNITFSITGMEKWSLQKITLSASAETGESVTIDHPDNREGILTISADFLGVVTIVADSCYKEDFTALKDSTAKYTLTVKESPTITTTSLPDGVVGISYGQELEATGDDPITWKLESGELPEGLELSDSMISGTPTKRGTYTFTISASNGISVEKEFTIVITESPTITTASLQNGKVGDVYSQKLTATGDTPITWALKEGGGELPAGLELSTSGMITGTPAKRGVYSFTIIAANATGVDAEKEYTIVITESPTITTTRLPNGKLGEPYSQELTATGDTPIAWTLKEGGGELPIGLELSDGTISGTPTKEGTYTFIIKATNATGVDVEKEFTIIIATADAPVIATYTVTYNSQGGSKVGYQTAESNKTISTPATPTKTGYSFKGWYTAAAGGTKVSFPYTVTKNVTMYAQWTASTYTVKFNKNGGTKGSMSNQSLTYDKAQKLTKNKFTRKGYVFAGWALTKTGAVKYKDNVSVKNLATSGNVTVYAVWTKVKAPTKAPGSVKLNNKKAKQLTVTYKKVSGANGYRIQYTTDSRFKKGITTKYTTKLTYNITKLKKNTKYYVRVAAYKLDSTNQKIVGKQSSAKSKATKK